ncbi:hypothetical protein BDZ89DRAFT_1054678 [Hymenopellis radicata]|nr:hypothetical protein BDZ89DRAFT_1054678 [Hymenopellis radicata]
MVTLLYLVSLADWLSALLKYSLGTRRLLRRHTFAEPRWPAPSEGSVSKFTLNDDDVFDASNFGSDCLQLSNPSPVGSEECLTINILRPSGTRANSSLPVLFWQIFDVQWQRHRSQSVMRTRPLGFLKETKLTFLEKSRHQGSDSRSGMGTSKHTSIRSDKSKIFESGSAASSLTFGARPRQDSWKTL